MCPWKISRVLAFLLISLSWSVPGAADLIRVDGRWLEDVHVTEGSSAYYVRIPSDGITISVPKSDVTPGDVVISDDREERAALRARWRENRNDPPPVTATRAEAAEFQYATDLAGWLEPYRRKHNFPALGAAVIVEGRVAALGVTGYRKVDSVARVTRNDAFHMGSCTKAMTATLIGLLVEEGRLEWDTTILDVFPELDESIHPEYRAVTLRHLLAHWSGTPGRSADKGLGFGTLNDLPGTPREQRATFMRILLSQAPEATPGAKHIYSNSGYAIAGAMAEQVTDTDWETLMQQRIFGPLGMQTAGFGHMASPGEVDGPWQHILRNGKPRPVAPGPFADVPGAHAPAGKVHCSMGDWTKFIGAHLEGFRVSNLLSRETYRSLHTPGFGGEYAGGWQLTDRPWGRGTVLTHAGSNNQNFCVVWMAPRRNFAVMVATNVGGDGMRKACDNVVWSLIQEYLLSE